MKVSELSGALLDYAVAKAQGMEAELEGKHCIYPSRFRHHLDASLPVIYNPSVHWLQGGPIIERERIQVMPALDWNGNEAGWNAFVELHRSKVAHGVTPLVAAMRAYVMSKFGEEVNLNDPE